MYLKKSKSKDGYLYGIYESYRDGDWWKHRKLVDLGPRPHEYIVYPGGNSFYLKESLTERIREQAWTYDEDELEALFLPFLNPEIRRIVETFSRPRKSKNRWRSCPPEVLLKHHGRLHPFDKRRLHYLRFGRVDIGNLDGRAWKFLNVLLEKSRDEIEHMMEEMERELPPEEIRPYLYTALHLQTHFRHLLTRNHPAALDPEKVDHHFLKDICRLNLDKTFFAGVERNDSTALHAYLIRYVILYFDHAFDPRSIWDEYVQTFRWKHQFYSRPPSPRSTATSEKEACRCLGISFEDFETMDRAELARCFRIQAKETHPDKGGDHKTFVKLKEAYECLLTRKA